MRSLAVLTLFVLLAGCGVLDDEGPALTNAPDPAVYGPEQAVPREQPPFDAPKLAEPAEGVARALDAGQIGVVDLTGTVAIQPDTLETASDQTLEGVRWSRWDAGGAEGEGSLRALTCQPTCASGGTKTVPARVRLTGVRVCDGRQYYERGEVLLDPKDTPSGSQPATYLRAPC
jgi:hypothetical protein